MQQNIFHDNLNLLQKSNFFYKSNVFKKIRFIPSIMSYDHIFLMVGCHNISYHLKVYYISSYSKIIQDHMYAYIVLHIIDDKILSNHIFACIIQHIILQQNLSKLCIYLQYAAAHLATKSYGTAYLYAICHISSCDMSPLGQSSQIKSNQMPTYYPTSKALNIVRLRLKLSRIKIYFTNHILYFNLIKIHIIM